MRVLNGDDSGFRDNFYWKFTVPHTLKKGKIGQSPLFFVAECKKTEMDGSKGC